MNTIEGVSTISPTPADDGNAPTPMSLAERVRGVQGAPQGQPPVPDIDSPVPEPSPDDDKDEELSDIWRALFVRQLWLASFEGSQERYEEIGDV
ncbi:hypothetical protein PAN31117_03480 [Pandoraea anapnoica]|uniref:Uncharacterized protein n=1 Tax=Pandoraea anapnoica TaxID=2508301 RepID=A0A5E5A8A8_9BURK|nr:hypothetical protein [Pandoraea anapnoica]VVE69839.1 hypothetical protein PAN31117_03480 [Pandoraea anapnoica]